MTITYISAIVAAIGLIGISIERKQYKAREQQKREHQELLQAVQGEQAPGEAGTPAKPEAGQEPN